MLTAFTSYFQKWGNWKPFALLWHKIRQLRKHPSKPLQVTNCETPMYFLSRFLLISPHKLIFRELLLICASSQMIHQCFDDADTCSTSQLSSQKLSWSVKYTSLILFFCNINKLIYSLRCDTTYCGDIATVHCPCLSPLLKNIETRSFIWTRNSVTNSEIWQFFDTCARCWLCKLERAVRKKPLVSLSWQLDLPVRNTQYVKPVSCNSFQRPCRDRKRWGDEVHSSLLLKSDSDVK